MNREKGRTMLQRLVLGKRSSFRNQANGDTGGTHAASSHAGRNSDHPAGDIEPGEGAGRRALRVRSAMRLAELPGWDVSGRSAPSDAEAPRGRSVQTERAVREWQLFRGHGRRQAL